MSAKFNVFTALKKAAIRTVSPLLIGGLSLVMLNPNLLSALLGRWKEVTIAELVVMGVELARNYVKNKN